MVHFDLLFLLRHESHNYYRKSGIKHLFDHQLVYTFLNRSKTKSFSAFNYYIWLVLFIASASIVEIFLSCNDLNNLPLPGLLSCLVFPWRINFCVACFWNHWDGNSFLSRFSLSVVQALINRVDYFNLKFTIGMDVHLIWGGVRLAFFCSWDWLIYEFWTQREMERERLLVS